MTAAKLPDTYQGLLEHQQGLAVYCARCQRWGTVNLTCLVLLGHGRCHWRGATFRCIRCGETTMKAQVGPIDGARSADIPAR
jgi:hypothetical protein